MENKGLDKAVAAKSGRRKHAKKKGSRKELEAITILHSLGFTCTKAGGSFGNWDVVAIDEERVLLIQVKSNRWPPQQELQRLMAGKLPEFCARLIFRFDDRKPLKVATMIEKDGEVRLRVIEPNAYTEAQKGAWMLRREEYHREKALATSHAKEVVDEAQDGAQA